MASFDVSILFETPPTIEHINGKLKHFWILAEHYRNRRKRFSLRMHLIAGMVNWMLLN